MVESPSLYWRPQSPWRNIAETGRFGAAAASPGIRITLNNGGGAATLMVSASMRAAFAAKFHEIYGLRPPIKPRREIGRDLEMIWAGPDQWCARSPRRDLALTLTNKLAGVAAIADQSGARANLQISGERARDFLAKGCPIDLHPSVFKTGDAALTAIAHIGIHIWQIDDSPSYNVAVFRSMARSFWSWISASAAEYGFEVLTELEPPRELP